MNDHHHLRWKILLALGFFAVLLGLFLLFFPGTATLFFLQLAGIAIILLSAVFMTEGLFIDTEGISKWVVLCLGLVGILAGILAIAAAIVIVLAAGLILGVFLIIFGIGETILGLALIIAEPMVRFVIAILGIFAIVVGLFLLLHPAATLEIIGIIVGFFLILFGLMQISHGLNDRRIEASTVVRHL
jgi:uncharacterized membrane protein HdeD (DUF308 family)